LKTQAFEINGCIFTCYFGTSNSLFHVLAVTQYDATKVVH